MGWARTLFLGDIGNRLDIEDTERDVERLKRDLARSSTRGMSLDARIEKLSQENAELKLYLASVVRLLMAKGTISTAELKAVVDAVDAEDGASDGKYKGSIL